VVLLAGVVEPWTMLLPVAERLHQAGHPVLVVLELAFNLASVRNAAAVAQAAIVERDLRDVILVAHSKGGLVGKRLLIDDTEGRIAALIAIATPFHGSSLARRSLLCVPMTQRSWSWRPQPTSTPGSPRSTRRSTRTCRRARGWREPPISDWR
jgi:alpha-beta hydrolase superfamily lysophospholipase